jgi:DNA-binding NarL/FixJ family response regulator
LHNESDDRRDFQLSDLTPVDIAVVRLLIRGYNNETIAKATDVKKRTITNRVSNLYRKLGVPSRNAAIVKLITMIKEEGRNEVFGLF